MTSTGFAVRAEDAHRLPPAYTPDAAGALVLDEPGGADSAYARAPAFPAANGGLVSTLQDYLLFARVLRAGGVHEERRLMSEAALRRMTSNQLTREERAASPAAEVFLGASGWGLGVGVAPDSRFGWAGYGTGYGTSVSVHPDTGRIVLLATQRMPPSTTLISDVDAVSHPGAAEQKR